MTRISFVMITARTDYPYLGRPNLHIFEPTLESFKQQTMTDFEWIIVDALYEQRKDYFKNLDLPFSIKHVPAHPNLWHEKGLPGICTQYNKGIIYADGKLLFFTTDTYMFRRDFMELLWKYFLQGYFPIAWYLRDCSPKKFIKEWAKMLGVKHGTKNYPGIDGEQIVESPVPYNVFGYKGENVLIEHRYYHAFGGLIHRQQFKVPYEWWFANSSASLDAMLKINGFDQKFDGDRMLLDSDVGSRLEMAGYGDCLVMFKNVFAIRPLIPVGYGASPIRKGKVTIKCPLGLLAFNRCNKRFKANITELSDKDIETIKTVWCGKRCQLREQCKKEHPWQYPFEHKDIPSHPPSSKSSKEWFNFWKTHQGLIDLSEEREKRLSGHKKYKKGTFMEAR